MSATNKTVFREELQCGKKFKHRSKAAAKLFLKRARGMPGKDDIKIYRCAWCGYWHLGRKWGKKDSPEEKA